MRKYTEDEKFMKEAIKQAKKAEAIGDVPIGCVIVHDGKVIARGYNKRNKDKTVLAHAELLAMKKAWRLAIGRLYDVHYFRTLSDVCRSDRAGTCDQSGYWKHECEGRLWRFHS